MSLKNPVQYPVRYYNNTMTDAPIISSADGSIKTILKACLVTGFGSEAGAGWEMPFEDTNRMILRTPKRTGSPPDFKVEDGDVNGTYRNGMSTYAFETATSLDDTNVIVDYNQFPTKVAGLEWHLFATDFGCLFYCNSSRYGGYSCPRIMYFGGLKKLQDAENEIFVINKMTTNGVYANSSPYFLSQGYINANTNTNCGAFTYAKLSVPPQGINSEDFYQKLLNDSPFYAESPFFVSLSRNHPDVLPNDIVSDGSRQLLRLREDSGASSYYYVPLDYWEL